MMKVVIHVVWIEHIAEGVLFCTRYVSIYGGICQIRCNIVGLLSADVAKSDRG